MENTIESVSSEPVKAKSLFQNALYFGVITGIVYILVSMLYYVLDVDRTGWVNYITFVVLIAGIFFGTKTFRDKFSGGFLSYGRCLGSGVLISLVVGVIMAVFTYLFYAYFDTGELARLIEATEQNMVDKGMTDEQIDQAMAISSKFMTPLTMSVSLIFGMVFWGTIFSLILSIFLKKENDGFDATFSQS